LQSIIIYGKPIKDQNARRHNILLGSKTRAKSDEEKAETFTIYFSEVFKHNSQKITLEKENKLLSDATIVITLDHL